ncbi:TetR family transcriptional regulator, partial [Xanthomonas perforans]
MNDTIDSSLTTPRASSGRGNRLSADDW